MSSLIIDLHDYYVLVLVLGDGGLDDRSSDVVLAWAEVNLLRFVVLLGD